MFQHEVTVNYTEPIVRAAAWTYWRNAVGSTGFALGFLFPGLFLLMWAVGYPTWVLGLFGGLAIAWAGLLTINYLHYRRASLGIFRRMKDKSARFSFSEDRIRAEADTGATEFAWKMVDKLIEAPEFWLLSIVQSTYVTLPTDNLSEEARSFISATHSADNQKVKKANFAAFFLFAFPEPVIGIISSMKAFYTIGLLVISNIFMTLAWYGHLKFREMSWFSKLTLPAIVVISWGIALFEYAFQVPANRIGSVTEGGPFTLWQLKVIQEAITLVIFSIFMLIFFRDQTLRLNHAIGFALMIAAVYFVFKD